MDEEQHEPATMEHEETNEGTELAAATDYPHGDDDGYAVGGAR
jgi:hypothetical protein